MAGPPAGEESLQDCSLNRGACRENGGTGAPFPDNTNIPNPDTIIELNSDLPLPYGWDQYLDLQTGEIYYINGLTGMKTSDDPRNSIFLDDFYSGFDEDHSSDEYESVGSSSGTSPPPPPKEDSKNEEEDVVLISKGCKACFSFYMIPKNDDKCPKCKEEMLEFDGVDEGKNE